jgi:hypothetical protein
MKKRNFNNGRFARQNVSRELPESVKIKMWMTKWMVRGFIAVLLYAGVVNVGRFLISEAKSGWAGLVERQKGLLAYSQYVSSPVVHFIAPEASAEVVDVEELKQEVVSRLVKLESGGFNPDDGAVFYTHDSPKSLRAVCNRIGGKRNLECESWGIAQVKIPTLMMWSAQLGTPMTEKEALNLALDDEKIQKFVGTVLIEIKGSCFAWTTCVKHSEWFSSHIAHIREITN